MRRAVLAGLATCAVLAASAGLAGCGVPGRTGVTEDAVGPPRNVPGADAGRAVPNGPADARTDQQLVEYFLEAAAGDVAGASKRLAAFLDPAAKAPWPAGTPITVVRQVGEPVLMPTADDYVVEITLQPVGLIKNDRGIVDPVTQPPVTKRFTVRHRTEPGARTRHIVWPDNDNTIFLTSEALRKWYVPHPIYFWTPDDVLVPDLRYLPRSLEQPARPTQIIQWMLQGPADWLAPAVSPQPKLELRDNAVVSGDRLVVNLTTTASDIPPDRLLKQLRWSLRETHAGPVELQIERQSRGRSDGTAYQSANPVATTDAAPKAYCIVNGRIAAIVTTVGERHCQLDAPLPGAVPPGRSDIQAAAITTDDRRAALVVPAGAKRRLLLTSARPGQAPLVEQVGSAMAAMGRPVWLPAAGPQPRRGLVPAEGRLWLFTAGERTLEEVSTGPGLSDITAVAVAPDGRRIALVAGGRASVATLDQEKPALASVQPLPTSVSGIVGMGWSQQTHVVVGGKNAAGGPAIVETSVDGALENDLQPPGGLAIQHLAAAPNNAARSAAPGPVMVEAGDQAFDVYETSYPPIRLAAPASPAPTRSQTVGMPFFAD